VNVTASKVESGKRQTLTLTKDERDTARAPGGDDIASASAQHVLADVEAGDPRIGAGGQIESDAGGAGGNVEHAGWVRRHGVIDHLAAPPPVLAK